MKQPQTAIAVTRSPALFSSPIPHNRGALETDVILGCLVNETLRYITLIHKGAALCRNLFNFPWDAGGTDPTLLNVCVPRDTLAPRLMGLLSFSLVLALTDCVRFRSRSRSCIS